MPTDDASDDALPASARKRTEEISSADIVLGIPSFNNAETVGSVVIAAEVGLRKLFPEMRSVICVSDGGSRDETRERASAAAVGARAESLLVSPESPVPDKVVFEYGGPPGKGSALRAIFEIARRLGARACAVLDADLRSLTPYWIDRLLSPVVHHGYEFVTPFYTRHKHDGTITNAVAYPLTAALYGLRIRQPIGGDFCMSGEVATGYAEAADWDHDICRFGVDVWMTTSALAEGRRVCQTFLGAKVHDPKEPGAHLGPMFREVVGTLFRLAARHHDKWVKVEEAVAPPTFGFLSQAGAESVVVSLSILRKGFDDGRARYETLWRRVLSSKAAQAVGKGELDARSWVTLLYDYLSAFAQGGEEEEELIDSLIPLYFARTATFVEETQAVRSAEAELLNEGLVDAAVELKPYLIERWASATSAGTLSPP
ncbi:MAG: glycosyltransferase [Actinomycetota bacterium]